MYQAARLTQERSRQKGGTMVDILDCSGQLLLSVDRADLRGANLRGANLEDANLRGAYLQDADLQDANLRGVHKSLGIARDPMLAQKILTQIEGHPEFWRQFAWRSVCGTQHCIADWACTLSGPLGHYLDINLGTDTAATLLLWHPTLPLPSFDGNASEDETLGRLQALAATPYTEEI